MTTSRFTGQITTRPEKRVPKEWEAHLDTGAYIQGETTYHSKFSIWVPTPRNGMHMPSIFIRLSNPSGRSFARLTADELSDLYGFIRTNHTTAIEALAQAQDLSTIYREAERTLWLASRDAKNIQTTPPVS